MALNKSMPPAPRPQVSIILMGGTGTGKTTFTNLVGGAKFLVGDGLESCTSQIQKHKFTFEGKDVTIIDVPGFDDSSKSDIDILKIVTDFLAAEYKAGRRLTGILYFHRISDVRMGGASKRNYTIWDVMDDVDDVNEEASSAEVNSGQEETAKARLALLESRFAQLQTSPTLFKSTVDGGGKMFKHDATAESANAILRHVLFADSGKGPGKDKGRGTTAVVPARKDRTPAILQIQKELVDEKKELSDTAAGEELHRDIKKQMEKHQQEMAELLEQMEETKEDADLEDLERECQELKERMAHWYEESEKLNLGHASVHSNDGGNSTVADQQFAALESVRSVGPPPPRNDALPPPTITSRTSHITSTRHRPPPPPPSPRRERVERVSFYSTESAGSRASLVDHPAAPVSRIDTQTDNLLQEIADLKARLSQVEAKSVDILSS
ncbi:hypothetical protein D9757_015407 [Collybiopsis confluens]|uniref:AIG1-type G domain-containing protein n=1 Tax=Collybiopsis confluens TaxID=2823264 RepID=A0A8H5C387_9AGAR|nr:hypothetical protein D9757_015407 [Collybiopsis confluens]